MRKFNAKLIEHFDSHPPVSIVRVAAHLRWCTFAILFFNSWNIITFGHFIITIVKPTENTYTKRVTCMFSTLYTESEFLAQATTYLRSRHTGRDSTTRRDFLVFKS
jgi:hypothetical protein